MKTLIKFFLSALCVVFFMNSCQNESASEQNTQNVDPIASDGEIIPGQYIVVFKESKIVPAAKALGKTPILDRTAKGKAVDRISETSIKEMNSILSTYKLDDSRVLNYYTTEISGMAITLNDEEFQALSKDDNVASIEYDRMVKIPEFTVKKITTGEEAQKMAQETPCGINLAGGYTDGSGKNEWIWVVDSGIDLDHPDLNVVTNPRYAKSFVEGESSTDDCLGHGTHVAGSAAAKDNGIGVVGVSAGAPVVPVRVFGCGPYASSSSIIAGIDHVGKYIIPGDVINLSLGGYYGSGCSSNTPYKRAVTALADGGAFVTIAAGNSISNSAYYAPACINGDRIYTVASMTCSRGFSSFSNYNMNPVDVIATGSSVRSTYLNGGYATLSGTSMAAPHVAGIVHARGAAPRSSGSVSHRGENYPIAVR